MGECRGRRAGTPEGGRALHRGVVGVEEGSHKYLGHSHIAAAVRRQTYLKVPSGGSEAVGVDVDAVGRRERHILSALGAAAVGEKHGRGFKQDVAAGVEQAVACQCRLYHYALAGGVGAQASVSLAEITDESVAVFLVEKPGGVGAR